MIRAPNCSANGTANSNAFLEQPEKSTGTRMFSNLNSRSEVCICPDIAVRNGVSFRPNSTTTPPGLLLVLNFIDRFAAEYPLCRSYDIMPSPAHDKHRTRGMTNHTLRCAAKDGLCNTCSAVR